MKTPRCPKYALKVIFEWDEFLTYRDSEIMRMSSTDRKWTPIKSTISWHACFGTHSPIGCDGCDHWLLCMHASDERLQKRENKTTYFKGAIIVEEEREESKPVFPADYAWWYDAPDGAVPILEETP